MKIGIKKPNLICTKSIDWNWRENRKKIKVLKLIKGYIEEILSQDQSAQGSEL